MRLLRFARLNWPFRPFWMWRWAFNLDVQRWRWERAKYPLMFLPDNLSQGEKTMEKNPKLQKKANPGEIAIKGTMSKTDVGSTPLRDAARKSVEKESKNG